MSTGRQHHYKKTSIIIRRFYTEKESARPSRIHSNEGHEIYMLLKGDVSFSIEGRLYKMEPYDMLVISNQEIHHTIVNTDKPFERIYLYFDPELLEPYRMQHYNLMQLFEERRNGMGNRIDRSMVEKNNIRRYFDEMLRWYQTDVPEREVMMISILMQFLVTLNRAYSTYGEEDEKLSRDMGYNDKIYKVIHYISSNLDRKITLEELEKKFFINKYHLCHQFKDLTGYTMVEYMNYKKVLFAKEQLKKGKPISEVWVLLGFEDYSSFYRTFKKMVGISPKEYLANAKKKS